MKKPTLRFKGFDGEWVEKTLDEASTYIKSGKNRERVLSGMYPVYGSTGIIGSCNNYQYDGESILIARVGANAGLLNLVNGKYDVSDNTLILKLLKDNNQFVKYNLGFRNLNRLVFGSGQPLITAGQLKNIEIAFASSTEQNKIGSFFAELDSLIEEKRVKLDKLKKLKQAYLGKMFPKKGFRVPEVRFKGFTGEWEEVVLSDLVVEVTRKAEANSTAPVMMISASDGFINQSEKYSSDNAGSSLKNYTLLKKGELAYNHGYSKLRNYGSCFTLNCQEARVPFVYHTFSLKYDDPQFYGLYLNSGLFDKELKKRVASSARMDGLLNITFADYTSLVVLRPNRSEQKKIASFFQNLDNLINLQQQELDKLANIKSACLSKMFA